MTIVDFGPIKEGSGNIFQSGWIDEPAKFGERVRKPYGILSLAYDGGFANSNVSDLRDDAVFLLRYRIDDGPTGVVPPKVLVGILSFLAGWINRGVSLHIHCVAGKSRSTYFHAGLRMLMLQESADEAIAFISERKPDILNQPGAFQQCFVESLHEFEKELAK